MGDQVKTNDDLALEAKDLLEGKERIFFDIQPTGGMKNIRFFVVLDKSFDFEKQLETFMETMGIWKGKFEITKYRNHNGQTVLMIYATDLPNSIAERVKEFYEWVVK